MPSLSARTAERPELDRQTEKSSASRGAARARGLLGFALVLSAAGMVLVLAMSVGPASISFGEVLSILGRRLSRGAVSAGSPAWHETVVVGVRLPRALVGFLVGGGLAVAGVALQGLFRNPLAEPGVLGISSGASLGAVVAIYLRLAARAVWTLPLAAFAGAAADALVVFAIAARRGRGRLFTATLLLVGVAVAALNVSLTTFVLSISLSSYDVGRQVVYWLIGGLEGRTWDHVLLGAPAVLVGTVVVGAHARDLDALLLGEVGAQSVGVDVARVRLRLVLASALLVGAAVAVAGPIGFVGLLVPHVVRLALGSAHAWLTPIAFVGGGLFLVLADVVARTLLQPAEIPVGVVTAAVGAPVFLALLVRRRVELAA